MTKILAAPADTTTDIFYFPKDSPSHYLSYMPNELLARLDTHSITPQLRNNIDALGATISWLSPNSHWVRIRFQERTHLQTDQQDERLQQLRQQLLHLPSVQQVQLNPIAHACATDTLSTPNDPYWKLQWNLHAPEQGGINLQPAWDITRGKGVTIAILDTGIAYEDYDVYHLASDLMTTHIRPGRDFVNGDDHPNDDHGHGTHVAGTIAQSTNNGVGVAGVAPEATLMPIKVLDANANGDYFTISEGIYYAVDHGADVINLSLGGAWNASVLEEAVRYAYQQGVTLVAAVGNEYANGNPTIYPSGYAECIAVGASTLELERASYSSTGVHLDVVAPGGDTTVDRNRDGYGDGVLQQTISRSSFKAFFFYSEGTSMAAPHVSGIAALLVSHGIRSPDAIREAMTSTAHDLGRSGWDSETGAGLVDAYAALSYEPVRAEPDVEITEMHVEPELHVNTEASVTLKVQTHHLVSGKELLAFQLLGERATTESEQQVWASNGEHLEIHMQWKPTTEGEYLLKALVGPIMEERNVANNEASVNVHVVSERVSEQGSLLHALVWQHSIIESNYWEVALDIQVQDEFKQPVPKAQVVIDWSYDSRIERKTAWSNAEGHAEIRSGQLPRWSSPTYYKRAVVKEGYRFAGFVAPVAQVGRSALELPVSIPAPDRLVLGTNYPNPFNPETWMPFWLGVASSVSLDIQDSRGAPVRHLELGWLASGSHASRSSAACWDGRNERGELVASGVYYYTLHAGSHQATRKMVVLR